MSYVQQRTYKRRAVRRLYQIAARTCLLPVELKARKEILEALNTGLAELGALPFEEKLRQYAVDKEVRQTELKAKRKANGGAKSTMFSSYRYPLAKGHENPR